MKNSVIASALWCLSTAFALVAPNVSRAVPYASSVSESGGTVTFYLNEDAENVKAVRTGQSTLNLGALSRGSHNFSLNGATAYEIQVTKSAAPIWVQTSQDTNPLVQFYAPRSIAVNQNPNSPYFGRIYVMDHALGPNSGTTGTGRTVTKGIFALNPDLTDALGQGDTGLKGGLDAFLGLDGVGLLGGNSRFDPWKIVVGDDDYIYIADAQDPRGSISRVDPNIANGELVLDGVGNTIQPSIHTVTYGLAVTGSLSNNNLTIWGTDGQWVNETACNSVLRWNINGAPLPFANAPTAVAQPGFPTTELDSDLDVAPDGNIFVLLFRSIVDAGGLKVYSPSGSLLWTSLIGGTDVFLNARMLAVSPDNSKLAVIRADRQTVIVALTNGPSGRIPDMSSTNLVPTFTGTSGNGRTVAWDRAGNLYAANPSSELLRAWSPGGTTTATTKSDGTFNITTPQTTVSITNSVTSVAENSGTPLVFTLNRAGNTADPLTVNLLVSGTASNGVHYTPAIPASITFAGGATSTNITVTPVNNGLSEFSKTVTILIGGGTNYSAGTPNSRTATILDDDTPEISMALATSENRLLEGYSHGKVTFQLIRKGLLTATPTVNISYSGGQAALGSKFNGPSSISFAANAVTTNFNITSINNQTYEGNQTAVAAVASGAGYNAATNTAVANVIDDEVSPGTILFSDNFNTASSDTSANWVINSQDSFSDTHADFGFDYTTVGISPLPGGSDTLGLRLRCNQVNAAVIDISLSPLGLDLGTSDYRLIFNMWINYNGISPNGPLADGGAGSTYHLDAGVGTTGDHPNWQNFFGADGVWFSIDGDGGSGATSAAGDANAYFGQNLFANDSGVYAAGTVAGVRSTPHPFYSVWGGISGPPAQVTISPTQAGLTQVGNMGMSWHTVVITKVTNIVTWAIDGVTIATVTNDPLTLSTNVFVGYHDQFAGISGTPSMSFAVIDNLKVMAYTDLPPVPPTVPNITSIQVVGGNVQINFTAGAADAPSAFTLVSSATVNGTYTDAGAVITGGSGSYQATVSLNGSARFYQISR